MASYKRQFMDVLMSNYEMHTINIGGRDVPIFSRHFNDIMANFDYQKIIRENGLTGHTKPQAIVQYFIPVENQNVPVVAFIWSWGGPWAYVHNMQWESCSESGGVNLNVIIYSSKL